MKKSIFFRLIKVPIKEEALLKCVFDLRHGQANQLTFFVHQETFAFLPGSPMPYWVSDDIRKIFTSLPKLEGEGGSIQHGASTKNDFRFLRLWWEVSANNIARTYVDSKQNRRWVLFAKGGEFSPYYSDIHLLINWGNDASEINEYLINRYPYLNGNADWVLHPENKYFEYGITFPSRPHKMGSFRIMPLGCIFSHVGHAFFPRIPGTEYIFLALMNSRVFNFLVFLFSGRGVSGAGQTLKYEAGTIQQIPIPKGLVKKIELGEYSKQNYRFMQLIDSQYEISHIFHQPSLLKKDVGYISKDKNGSTRILLRKYLNNLMLLEDEHAQFISRSFHMDQELLDLYGISNPDRTVIDSELGFHSGSYRKKNNWSEEDDANLRLLYLTKDALPAESDEENGQEDDDDADNNQRRSRRATYRTLEEIAHELKIHPASIAARCQALGFYRPEEFLQAIADLISYCVGCLFSRWDIRIGAGELEPPPLPDPEEGLPLYPPGALRPDSPPLEAKGALGKVLEHTASRGILVDDPGHPHDLVAGVEACLSYLFGEDKQPAIRAEIDEALGRDLRLWLARYFFPLHIKHYSKSRRKAPIYWQLATPSRSYSLWLYYQAIGADTLYTAVREYVSPKIKFEEDRLAELKSKFERLKTNGPAREARGAEKAIEDQESFLQELYAFRSELQRLADWGYHPDLNDGVILNIAPLHRLVPWREAEKYWEKLIHGEYDWSSMAKHVTRQRQEKDRLKDGASQRERMTVTW